MNGMLFKFRIVPFFDIYARATNVTTYQIVDNTGSASFIGTFEECMAQMNWIVSNYERLLKAVT